MSPTAAPMAMHSGGPMQGPMVGGSGMAMVPASGCPMGPVMSMMPFQHLVAHAMPGMPEPIWQPMPCPWVLPSH